MGDEILYNREIEEGPQRDLLTGRFLAELSRKIGSEWILVCVALGVPQPELDHINYDGSVDVPTKIYKGLQRWRVRSQGRSEWELINELMDALIQNGRQDLVDPDVFGTYDDPRVTPRRILGIYTCPSPFRIDGNATFKFCQKVSPNSVTRIQAPTECSSIRGKLAVLIEDIEHNAAAFSAQKIHIATSKAVWIDATMDAVENKWY